MQVLPEASGPHEGLLYDIVGLKIIAAAIAQEVLKNRDFAIQVFPCGGVKEGRVRIGQICSPGEPAGPDGGGADNGEPTIGFARP